MTLNAEQIEQVKEKWFHACGGAVTREEFLALCDMAHASLRAQQGVMVSVPREPDDQGLIDALGEAVNAAGIGGGDLPHTIIEKYQRALLPMLRSLAAAPSAQNAAPHYAHPAAGIWLIYFHDSDRRPEIFTDEGAARRRWGQISVSWNADLFRRVEKNYRDDERAGVSPSAEEVIERCAIRGRIAQLEGKLVDEEIRSLKSKEGGAR